MFCRPASLTAIQHVTQFILRLRSHEATGISGDLRSGFLPRISGYRSSFNARYDVPARIAAASDGAHEPAHVGVEARAVGPLGPGPRRIRAKKYDRMRQRAA